MSQALPSPHELTIKEEETIFSFPEHLNADFGMEAVDPASVTIEDAQSDAKSRFESSAQPTGPGTIASQFLDPSDHKLQAHLISESCQDLQPKVEQETAIIPMLPVLPDLQALVNGEISPADQSTEPSHSSSEISTPIQLLENLGMSSPDASRKGSIMHFNLDDIGSIQTPKRQKRQDEGVHKPSKAIRKKATPPQLTKEAVEEIQALRAKRNRESAQRSRLKTKLHNQRVSECYYELKQENVELKRIVETLLKPEYTKAPADFQETMLALIRRPRKDGRPLP